MRVFRTFGDRKEPKPPALCVVGTDGLLRIISERDGERIGGDPEGSRRLLRTFRDHRVFTLSTVGSILRSLDARHFEGTLWKRRIVAVKLDDGPRLYTTRQVFHDYSLEDAFAEILTVDRFCREHRVAFGSFGWTAEQFFRMTLSKDLSFFSPGRLKGVFGGRKDCPDPRLYGECFYVDLRAAYPHAMVSEPFPLRLGLSARPDLEAPVGIGLATVHIPDSLAPWTPLPRVERWGLVWEPGDHRQWYSLRELRMAIEAGADVKLEATLVGSDYCRPFDGWWDLMRAGRDLRAGAGRIMKLVSNSLWGLFAMHGRTHIVRFENAAGTKLAEVVRERPSPPTTGAFVGGEIAARVRERIYRELVPSNPAYIDTDGGVIPAGASIPEPYGDDVGEWSIRDSMLSFEPKGPQAYAWRGFDGFERIILAGTPKASRPDLNRYQPTILASSWRPWAERKIRSFVPTVFDENGEPVPVLVPPPELPEGWTQRDPLRLPGMVDA